jgi:hypothetical protein
MKKRLAVWVFFIMLSLALSLEPSFAPGLASGLMAQPGLGAASIAKGGVSLGEGDPLWALWNDPSGLIGARMGSVGELAKTTQAWNGFGFMVHRPFGLTELDQRVLSAVWSPRHYSDSVRTRAWGVGLYDSGDELFRESKLRLGWATATADWAVGLASSVNHAGFGGGYGRLLAVQLDASARLRLSHGMQLLIGLENAGRARWRSVDQLHAQSPLPSRMRVGLHWQDPRLRSQYWLQLQWEPSHLPDLRYGVDWEAFSEQSTQLNLRAGLTTNTQLSSFYPSIGVGLSHRRLRLNMAAHPHPQLGWSPVIDLAFDR